MSIKPKALVLRTAGTNCDQETLHALEIAGANVALLHLNELIADPKQLDFFKMMVLPGGFSYGDDVSAGKILSNELKSRLGKVIGEFVAKKRIVIGICNGFQVLTKLGLLPAEEDGFSQSATLAHNDSGRFQCEWVALKREKSKATWLNNLPLKFDLPMAHGEGKFVTKDSKVLSQLEKNGQVVFRYEGNNPNGSINKIAGITNPSGNVVGMMPHPERFVIPFQHPAWTRLSTQAKETPGFLFWKAAVRRAIKGN